MHRKFLYLVGVDGGGTGTRVILRHVDGHELGHGQAGPSGLMHGVPRAWQAIQNAISLAFFEAGFATPPLNQIALGCGLAGMNNDEWSADFLAKNPGFGLVVTASDALTNLIGAFGGEPGVVIALGTGSVGLALLADGSKREVGGWGFPSGDEASGAWLGLRALNHAQHVADGRCKSDSLANAVLAFCGGSRETLMKWGIGANQTSMAQLAPLVVQTAESSPHALALLQEAGRAVALTASALDPSGAMPIALNGGLASSIKPYLPDELKVRVVPPQTDAATGALILLQKKLLSEGGNN